MTGMEFLRGTRERYVERYRAVVRAKREEGAECSTEVWLDPDVKPGEPRPPHPLCADILIQGADGPSLAMVSDESTDGPLAATMFVRDVPVKLYAANWEAMPLWFRHPDPDWAVIEAWQKKWMDRERGGDPSDEDGLCGVVHYLGRPTAEAGGHLYSLDLGSAPVEALTELLEALATMGASEIEVGRSDGSDLPADVLAAIARPDLSLPELTTLVARVLSDLPDIERVERVNDEALAVFVQSNEHPQRMFLSNLHRLLMRTSPDARPREFNRFLRGQRESMGPSEVPDLAQLRVLVKDNRFLDNIRTHAPGMKPLVRQPLAGDLWLVCVWDAPNGMRFATEDEAALYEISPEQMMERARQNFLAERPPVEVAEAGPLRVAQTNDCYDATLLIDDKWWSEIAGQLRGAPLACVPARNVVLIGGSEDPKAIPAMRALVKQIESAGDHLISDTILVRRNGAWDVYADPDPAAPRPEATIKPKRPWWRFW